MTGISSEFSNVATQGKHSPFESRLPRLTYVNEFIESGSEFRPM